MADFGRVNMTGFELVKVKFDGGLVVERSLSGPDHLMFGVDFRFDETGDAVSIFVFEGKIFFHGGADGCLLR